MPDQLITKWKELGISLGSGEKKILVFYFSLQCGECEKWIRFLNVIHELDSSFQVWGILSRSESLSAKDEVALLDRDYRFPIKYLNESTFLFHVPGVPTVFKVSNQEIVSRWSGDIPGEMKNLFYNLKK